MHGASLHRISIDLQSACVNGLIEPTKQKVPSPNAGHFLCEVVETLTCVVPLS
jgi:hypothetical protein